MLAAMILKIFIEALQEQLSNVLENSFKMLCDFFYVFVFIRFKTSFISLHNN